MFEEVITKQEDELTSNISKTLSTNGNCTCHQKVLEGSGDILYNVPLEIIKTSTTLISLFLTVYQNAINYSALNNLCDKLLYNLNALTVARISNESSLV